MTTRACSRSRSTCCATTSRRGAPGCKYGGFESGLRTSAGKAKPSLDGFRLPLVAKARRRPRSSLWGLVRPATGATKVVVQQRSRHGGTFTR